MGHLRSVRSFPAEMGKTRISEAVNTEAREYSDSHSGLYNPIRWYDATPLADRDAAEDFLEAYDAGDYDQLAVRYFEPVEPVSSAKLRELTASYDAARKHAAEVANEFCFKGQKRKFATCRACGSSINLEMMEKYRVGRSVNDCPVCHEDMRPDTARKKAEAAEAAKAKALERLTAERKRLEAKAPKKTMWLVKYEYHV